MRFTFPMFMRVVSIVVCMSVFMTDGFMEMAMLMLLIDQEYCADDHQWNGKQEQNAYCFMEQQERQSYPSQGGRAEQRTGSCRTKPTHCQNEQRDAKSVTHTSQYHRP
jgi:hypothetical protein